jgi:AraC-like DNA-binding protein/mannose-6-phosphate isomerase-like protein (cupin superfamily)
MMNAQNLADRSLPPVEISSANIGADRAIHAFAGRQSAGYYDPPHQHDRGQFSYRTEGFATVKVEGRSILLSPGRGVWIPAGVVHAVTCRGPAAYNAFYVDGAAHPQPAEVRVIAVSPLLHALVEDAMLEQPGANGERQTFVTGLILDELARSPDVAAMAPVMPRSAGLRQICDQLSHDPARPLDLNAWAATAGMSRRTFTRTFREETGLSPGEWHQQLRMHFAETWMAQGVPLPKIALRLGYSSTASFSRVYCRIFGTLPAV